jgi:hypothetical protein
MYATYTRLNLHVSASHYDVVRASLKRLKPSVRFDVRYREARHTFLCEMLNHHQNARELVRYWRL